MIGRNFFMLGTVSMNLICANADAFILLRGSTYEKGERPVTDSPVWKGRVLRFYVNTNISALGGSAVTTVTGSELLSAMQEAAAAWTAACRADIRIEVAGTTSGVHSVSDASNAVVWDKRTEAEGNYYGTQTSSVLAAATTVLSGNSFYDCDIVVNGSSSVPLAYAPANNTEADLRSVLTHEIGHCLGLDHPIEPDTGTPSNGYDSNSAYLTSATMVQTSTLANNDTSRRDINQDDRDGVECIYERGRAFGSGARCGSYHGTNGGGSIIGQTSITGGPSNTDTICGSDAQGRNARPSEETGDGCIPSAVASTSAAKVPLTHRIGGLWGFFILLFIFRLRGMIRRRAT